MQDSMRYDLNKYTRDAFLSPEQMGIIDRMFPHRILGADVPVEKLREYMGERKVIEHLRTFVR